MRASDRFARVIKEIEMAKQRYPGPIFFGRRLEFAYGVFGLPSPLHLAVWWDPDTAFARDRLLEMEAAWRSNKFRTLVFLKSDAIYYRQGFLDELVSRYEMDQRWRDLTVLHSDMPGGSLKSPASE